MAHDHGNEYQIRIVREGGIEELSGWMKSTDEVTQAILTVPRTEEKTLWLMVRNTPGSGCPDKEQIVEYPITHIRSPRCIPHDSRYLRAMESNNRNYLVRSEARNKH
jgi:hypothetical protein